MNRVYFADRPIPDPFAEDADGFEGVSLVAQLRHHLFRRRRTLHFAHFVPLADTHLGFFTIYDGTFDKYIQDFTEKIGPVFDLMFKYVSDPPPTPVAKNAKAFLDYSGASNRPAIGFYSAYPGLVVQDIRGLLADAKAGAVAH